MNISTHWRKVKAISDEVLEWQLQLLSSAHSSLTLTEDQRAFVIQAYDQAWQRYQAASEQALKISRQALDGEYENTARSGHFNSEVARSGKRIKQSYVDKGFLSILDGITVTKQIGSLKYVYTGNNKPAEAVIDVMSSAATLNVGAGFPLFVAIDTAESLLGINENIGLLYHAGIHHPVYFDYLRSLHPNQASDPKVFSEHSGTAVNSVAIEAAAAHAKSLGLPKTSRLLAFNGTWSGGFGTAKEASGFGAAKQFEDKTGLQWIDRSLAIPHSRTEEDRLLTLIEQKIKAGKVSGIVFEKIIGDAGIIELSDRFVKAMLDLFAHAPNGILPVIVDDIHAGNARSSTDYWSFSKESGLRDYPKLILTNAKSSAGGKPYGFALIPASIVQSAYSNSMLTTHSGNGGVGRAVAFAKFITHPEIVAIKEKSAQNISEVLEQQHVKVRGRHFNHGIVANSSNDLEIIQNYLYIHFGILAGSFPSTLRFQPNVIEYPETLVNVATAISHTFEAIKNPDHSTLMQAIKDATQESSGGLNIEPV